MGRERGNEKEKCGSERISEGGTEEGEQKREEEERERKRGRLRM